MDHLADKNLTQFHCISLEHALPDFVKQAEIDDKAGELPEYAFADSAHRRFPCHTRADCWLSYAYFLKNAKALDKELRHSVYNNLRKFASEWGIYAECQKLQKEHEKAASATPDTLPDEAFAIVENWGGEKYRALPLVDADCVKQAASNLLNYRERYPVEWRVRAARKIASKAAAFQVPLEPYFSKLASASITSAQDIAESMLSRAYLVAREHTGDAEQIALLKAARAVVQCGQVNGMEEKLASILDQFDTHYRLKRLYARGLPTPEEVVYGGVAVKTASDLRSQLVQLINGQTYTLNSLKQAGLTPYRALGDDFVNAVRNDLNTVSVEKLAELLPTLPLDDANLLDKALRVAGVKSASAVLPKDQVADWSAADWTQALEAANS